MSLRLSMPCIQYNQIIIIHGGKFCQRLGCYVNERNKVQAFASETLATLEARHSSHGAYHGNVRTYHWKMIHGFRREHLLST